MIWPEMSVKSCISPENGEFDVRWVRFPKHIPLFSTLSQLESVGSWNWMDEELGMLFIYRSAPPRLTRLEGELSLSGLL